MGRAVPVLLVALLAAVPACSAPGGAPAAAPATRPPLSVLEEDPGNPEALLAVADLQRAAGRPAAEARHLRAFLRIVYRHPRRPEVVERLAALVPANPFVLVRDGRPGGFRVYRDIVDGALAVRVPAGPWRSESGEREVGEFLVDLHEATVESLDWFRLEGGWEARAYWGEDGVRWQEGIRERYEPWRVMTVGGPRSFRPAWGMSYFEARARARWAGKRVPTEAEWGKAARGGIHLDGAGGAVPNPLPSRVHPWGDEPVRGAGGAFRANVDEVLPRDDAREVDRSLPVDSLPEGASPYGCLHMAGNVTEWNDDLLEGGVHRNVRGGYFNDHEWTAAIDHREPRTFASEDMTILFKAGLRCAADPPPADLDAEEAAGMPAALPDPLDAARLLRCAKAAVADGDMTMAFRYARTAARLAPGGPDREETVRLVHDLRLRVDPWKRRGNRLVNIIDGAEAVPSGGLLWDVDEATEGAFLAFAAEGGYEVGDYWSAEGRAWLAAQEGPPGPVVNVLRYGSGDLPVQGLTFFEAEAFARWARKRLPTAAEWREASGTGRRPWPWAGGPHVDVPLRAALRDAFEGGIVLGHSDLRFPVGSFPRGASREGLRDLLGNVEEWVVGTGDGREDPFLVAGGSVWAHEFRTLEAAEDRLEPFDPGTTSRGGDDGFGMRCVADPPR